MKTTLAYQISRDLSDLNCTLHYMGISTFTSKELTVIKVCCTYFRDEIGSELEKRFAKSFIQDNIRFNLPISDLAIPATASRNSEG